MRLITLLSALEQRPLSVYIVEARTKVSDASIGATEWPPSIEDIEISGIAYDSREVGPGGLFVAVPGFHTDGRKFLAEAVQRGAVVAIGEPLQQEALSSLPPYIEVNDIRIALANLACAYYGYPAQQLCTIGVTGTDGKTTTCNLISAIFEAAGLQTGLMTTANFRISGQEWENATRQSTLEALEVQQYLRRMLDADVTHAVIEATSHGLELQRVRGCNFDVGVVTNITHEHLDFHKTLDNYRRAKARLFEMLEPGRDKGLGIQPAAILNRDDVSYDILKPYCRVPILSTRFHVLLPDSELMIETQLVGRFNVSNCLAAITTAYSQGIRPAAIAEGLAHVKGISGRMESINEGQPYSVIVDYAHTPDSLEKVLATLRPLTAGRLMVVFGSAGERDIQKRPIMGRIAAQMADFFVITDEDPREEDRTRILQEIAHGAEVVGKRQGRDFLCIADRTQAIAAAFAQARAGDTILLAGKGHEQSIIVGRQKVSWDDRRVAREELRRLQ